MQSDNQLGVACELSRFGGKEGEGGGRNPERCAARPWTKTSAWRSGLRSGLGRAGRMQSGRSSAWAMNARPSLAIARLTALAS